MIARYACREVIEAVRTDGRGRHPDLAAVNRKLAAPRAGSCRVPGLIPNEVFFYHLAHRRFPLTIWIRSARGLDYIVEPTSSHDSSATCRSSFNPVFRLHAGVWEKGPEALKHEAYHAGPPYWYIGVRADPHAQACGCSARASCPPSRAGLRHRQPRCRIDRFDPPRIMRTDT